jgi:glycosyltransferase involved in cell wall biosynthesis
MESADRPVVTIGLCVKDSEATLPETLESIRTQDFPHELIELISVDDGSTDKTLSLLSAAAAKMDIKTQLFKTSWKGVGAARNLVVKKATGDYILWVDSDQILPKDYVRKQVDFMEQNPTVGIAVGTPGFLNEKSFILTLELIPTLIDYTQMNTKRSFPWKSEKLPGTGASIFRSKAIKEVNGFDERLRLVGEDQDAAKKIKNAGWAIKLNNVFFYERHGDMANFSALWKKYFRYGYGNQLLYRERRELFSLPRMAPFAGFIAGLLYSIIAYRTTRKKIVFLLPLHFTIKKTAWFLGFLKSQIFQSTKQSNSQTRMRIITN